VAKPLGSELLLSKRVFSAQDDPRQKLKICGICVEMRFLIMLNVLYDDCSLNSNIKCWATSFLEKDQIDFHLVAISQCEGG
jgi:hypothetical protein